MIDHPTLCLQRCFIFLHGSCYHGFDIVANDMGPGRNLSHGGMVYVQPNFWPINKSRNSPTFVYEVGITFALCIVHRALSINDLYDHHIYMFVSLIAFQFL